MSSTQLKTEEACAFLNVGRTTLYRLRGRGEVRCTKRGRLVRWPLSELERWIQRNTRAAR